MIALSLNYIKTHWIKLIFAASAVLVFFLINPGFIVLHTFTAIALITLPVSWVGRNQSGNNSVLWIMGILLLIGLAVPTTTGIYLYLILLIVYALGYQRYALSLPVLVHIGLTTPLFQYLDRLISFPIRIMLSEVVAIIISPFMEAHASGNTILVGGQEYLVDQACAGLYMLKYGLLFGTLILGFLSKKQPWSLGQHLGLYMVLIALTLLANVVRILALVIGDIGPSHWLHEAIGLFIYGAIVLLPFYWLCNQRKPAGKPLYIPSGMSKQSWLRIGVLSLFYIAMLWKNASRPVPTNVLQTNLHGYKKEALASGVWKYKKPDALVYLKPPVPGYKSDHNPTICWAGSGFAFKQINKWYVNDQPVNVAMLHKGNEKLYSAWWFESSEIRTSDQWTWRTKSMFDNQHFHLVNVTCSSPQSLLTNLRIILDNPSIFQDKSTHEMSLLLTTRGT